MFKVFYSWQSDLPNRTNRGLIQAALERACTQMGSTPSEVQPVVDRDTLGQPGAPDIAHTIFEKIEDASAFVADVSIINATTPAAVPDDGLFRRLIRSFGHAPASNARPTPNPNVLVELGYALHALGRERIILVMNTHFGAPDLLPFDLRQLRILAYVSRPDDAQPAPARRDVEQQVNRHLADVAAHAAPDSVAQRIRDRTLNIGGQAEALIRALMTASGQGECVPETVTRAELEAACRAIHPNGDAPFLGPDRRYAPWLNYLGYFRERSGRFRGELTPLEPFLKREHIGLLAEVEHCSYFRQLDHIAALGAPSVRNPDLSWLADSMWDYVCLARRLREYADRRLQR